MHVKNCVFLAYNDQATITMLITRREIFMQHPIIESEIAGFQKSFHDEYTLEEFKEENDEQSYWEIYDCVTKDELHPMAIRKIIGFEHQDLNTYPTTLSRKSIILFEELGLDTFYILSHLKLDFFGSSQNNYPPLEEAHQMLANMVKGHTYKEGFKVSLKDLPGFMETLFWICRCDPTVAEYIFICDVHESLMLFICRYGNIHLTEFGHEKLTVTRLKKHGWKIIEGREHDQFTP